MSKPVKKIVKTQKEKMQLVRGNALESAESPALMDADSMDTGEYTVISRSPMIRPGQLPLNKVLKGRLKRFITCTARPATKDEPAKLGTMMEIVPDGSQVGVALACTAILCGALRIQGVGETATSEFMGKNIAIRRLEEKAPSKKGQDAWNFIVAVDEKS